MSNTATLSLYVRNILKKARQKLRVFLGVENVPVSEAISQAETLEVSCYSFIRVLLSTLGSMEGRRHTKCRIYSTNVYIQIHSLKYST